MTLLPVSSDGGLALETTLDLLGDLQLTYSKLGRQCGGAAED